MIDLRYDGEKSILKKIGILTLYNDNYNFGGQLQAYALPTALNGRFEVDAEQIVMKTEPRGEDKKPFSCYQLCINIVDTLTRNKLNLRRAAFKQFMKAVPHADKCVSTGGLCEVNAFYDAFIVGSDQVWNFSDETPGLTAAFLLSFVEEGKGKISYAASCPHVNFSAEIQNICKQHMPAFDAISIREAEIRPKLEDMIQRRIDVVCDPVLLLDRSQWDKIAVTSMKKGDYILCYILGQDIEQRKSAMQFAKRMKKKLLVFPHILNAVIKDDLIYGNIRNYSAGPAEFIGMIRDAALVITDSYHACLFSMIYETPFYVFQRKTITNGGNMNSRIECFLKEYHMESRLVTADQLIQKKKVDVFAYDAAHEIWKRNREAGYKYLKESLRLTEKEIY